MPGASPTQVARPTTLGVLLVRALLAPALVFAAHLFLSLGLNAYKRVSWVDEAMHFAGGVTIALCFAILLDGLQRRGRGARLEPWLRSLLIVTLTCTAAVLWEFAEFLTDRWLGTTAQLELVDTLGDLLMGLLGGLAFVALTQLSPRMTEVNGKHPENSGPLAYLSVGSGAQRPLCASPDSVPDPYQGCGCHPDVVERLWDQLGAGLPRAARVLVFGTPALVQPESGVVLALGLGTSYALRLPLDTLDDPDAAALERVHRYSSVDQVLDLTDWGPAWRFGAYHRLEPSWLERAAAALAVG